MTVLIAGLDLGQKRDFSALIVVERVEFVVPAGNGRTAENTFGDPPFAYADHAYHVRHVQRWRRGTPYTAVVDDVAVLFRSPEMSHRPLLVFDATGVGGAVADMIQQTYVRGELGECSFPPWGVTFVAGYAQSGGAVGIKGVPSHKGDVIARMAMLLNNERLLVAPGLPAGELLEKELRAYQIKQRKTGSVYTEASKESDHDDLVTALALAVWVRPDWGRDQQRYVGSDGELREKL